MFQTTLQQDFTVTRKTPLVYSKDPVVANDTGLSISISPDAYLEVTISGFTSGTGSITVYGELNGSDVEETFTFVGNSPRQGSQQFDTITRVASSDLTDEASVGSVEIATTNELGEEQESESSVTTLRGRLIRPKEDSVMTLVGEQAAFRGNIIAIPDSSVRVGDLIAYGSDKWRIMRIDKFYTRGGEERHMRLSLETPPDN